jgi:hypothetical protein
MEESRLVVAVQLPDGTLLKDPKYIQPLKEYLQQPKREIVQVGQGQLLHDLLNFDLEIIQPSEEELESNYIKAGERADVRQESMKLLGRLAEPLIVRQCREDAEMNRKWASLARRGRQVEHLDNYIAVGTSLKTVKNHPKLKEQYNPHDTQRDIIWVQKEDLKTELRTTKSSDAIYRAGLQIKVSRQPKSVLNQLRKHSYAVPVVYFDLDMKDGFSWVLRQLENDASDGEQHWEVGVDLICGREISESLHRDLLEFLPLLDALLLGEMCVEDLVRQVPEIRTALISRYFATTQLSTSQPVRVFTLPQ